MSKDLMYTGQHHSNITNPWSWWYANSKCIEMRILIFSWCAPELEYSSTRASEEVLEIVGRAQIKTASFMLHNTQILMLCWA
jgi:hypothetical protein